MAAGTVAVSDYDSIVQDVRKQVMAELMDELRAGGMLPVGGRLAKAAPEEEAEELSEAGFEGEAEDAAEYDTEYEAEDDDLSEAGFEDEAEYETEDEELSEASFEEEDEDEDDLDGFDEIPEIDTEPEIEEELDEEDLAEEGGDEDSEEDEDAYEDDEYDFASLFDASSMEPEDSEADGAAEALAEDDNEAGSGFDVMKMLHQEARTQVDQRKTQEETVNLSDYVEPGGVADISLEDLADIVTSMRKKRRA